jgi:hypothetical protein
MLEPWFLAIIFWTRSLCGGGFEYLHLSPENRRRRRKENPGPGSTTETPCSSGLGESRIWDSKYGHESRGTRTREWPPWRGPATIIKDRHIFSSDMTPHIKKPASVLVPQISHNIILTLISKPASQQSFGGSSRLLAGSL